MTIPRQRFFVLVVVALAAAAAAVLVTQQNNTVAQPGTVEASAFAVSQNGEAASHNPWRGMSFGVADSDVRSVSVSGRETWVAQTGSQICFMTRSQFANAAFGSCASIDQAEANGSFSVSHPAPDVVADRGLSKGTAEVVGIVPNGVSEVQIGLANGNKIKRAVSSNMVSYVADSEPEAFTYTDANNDLHRGTLGAK